MICNKCNEEKSEDSFSFKSKKENKRQKKCKECTKQYGKTHYQRNKKKYLERSKINNPITVERTRKYIQSLKSKPCADCNVQYPFWIMHFDHLREKEYNIADMCDFSKEKIDKEVAKCEVVCANCHANRTYLRLNSHS